MGATKARWKRAPRDQRRLATGRTAPNARFTRRQISASLPPSLTSRQNRWVKPALLLVALVTMVGLSVALVIAVGAYIRAEQQANEMHERAGYYGLPTQPFSTLAPDQPGEAGVSTSVAIMTTPIPLSGEIVSSSESATARTEPNNVSSDGSNTLSSFCEDFGVPVSLELFDWNDWSTVNLTNALVAQLPMRWDASKTFWRGYDSPKPFDQPDDARSRWQLTLQTEDGAERWIHVWQSALTPDTLYVYAYQVITPFTDARGEHFGYHPCNAFTLPPADMNILLSSARAYQSSGSRFPTFIPVNDPQWVLGNITPNSSSFEVRSVPTLQNNNPLQTVSSAMPCYFVTHDDWGTWAQIKLGNTIGWVDTSTVTLKASS